MLSDEFDRKLLLDREEVDLLIVIGTSLRVSLSTLITFSTNSVVSGISRRSDCQYVSFPSSSLANLTRPTGHLPHSVPQILINRDPITHANFDIHLLGDGDTIVQYLCDQLGPQFDLARVVPSNAIPTPTPLVAEVKPAVIPEQVATSHVWLFPGANGGKWVESVREAFRETDDEGDAVESEVEGLGARLEVPILESRSRSRSEDGEGDEEESKRIRIV